MLCTLGKFQNASKHRFSWKDLIRELDRNTQNACGNCTVPAAAIITYRRSATPGRLWKILKLSRWRIMQQLLR